MKIELKNTGSSDAMERHYQRLIETGWEADISKETRTIKGFKPSWDVEETKYYISTSIEPTFVFDLSEVLKCELIVYKEDGQPVIEIYDDWRE